MNSSESLRKAVVASGLGSVRQDRRVVSAPAPWGILPGCLRALASRCGPDNPLGRPSNQQAPLHPVPQLSWPAGHRPAGVKGPQPNSKGGNS